MKKEQKRTYLIVALIVVGSIIYSLSPQTLDLHNGQNVYAAYASMLLIGAGVGLYISKILK